MPRVAIFDSGVGGLSIYQAVREQRPDCEYVFVSDNEAYPYGTKPQQELEQRVVEVVERIIKQFNPDCLIVACNTASTIVLPVLRAKYSLPIVGVVPAIKPAAKLSKTKKIGLLATPATIQRQYTNQLIKEFASDCDVIKIGSSHLVDIVEQKIRGVKPEISIIENEIADFFEHKDLDTVVLACTHFPLLNNEINVLFKQKNHDVTLVDSGKGIANRVNTLLAENIQSQTTQNQVVFTKAISSQNEQEQIFQKHLSVLGFDNIILLGEPVE